jgi:hypothetical protein
MSSKNWTDFHTLKGKLSQFVERNIYIKWKPVIILVQNFVITLKSLKRYFYSLNLT